MPKFTKKIMRPGTYEVSDKNGGTRRVFISGDRLKKWAETFKSMTTNGLRIPAPWRHDPKAVPLRLQADEQDTDAFKNAGWWEKVWVDESDNTLYGELNVPRQEDASKVGTTVTEVSPLAMSRWTDGNGDSYEEALTHIALVTHPIVTGQDNFVPEELAAAIAFSSDNFITVENIVKEKENEILFAYDDSGEGESEDVRATGATIAKALPILRKIGLSLPADTDESNFAERVIVAACAIKGSKEDDEENLEEEPDDSEEKPSPIVMSKLTPEQEGTLAFAKQVIVNQYASRIKECVERGKITPAMAEQIKPITENLEIEFSSEGKIKPSPLDQILMAWEAIPEGSILTGKNITQAKKESKGSTNTFSIGSLEFAFNDQEPPSTDASSFDDVTEEQAEEALKAQAKAAGITFQS